MIVKAPLDYFPYMCLATGRDDGEIIDTGMDAPTHPNLPTHVYLHAQTLRDIARSELDMVPAEDVREAQKQLQEMGVKLAELMEQVDALTTAERVINEIKGEPCPPRSS